MRGISLGGAVSPSTSLCGGAWSLAACDSSTTSLIRGGAAVMFIPPTMAHIRCLHMMWKWWLSMTTSLAACSTLLPS